MEINRLSLNSLGAFRTMIHNRTPQAKNNTSTVKQIQKHNEVRVEKILNEMLSNSTKCDEFYPDRTKF